MAGNLKAFQGAGTFDTYAEHLRILGEPILPRMGFLWAFRAFMLAAFVIHVLLSWQTSRQSWAARQTKYRRKANQNFDFASSWMRWGGVLILVFLVFHILHMTTGTLHPNFEAATRPTAWAGRARLPQPGHRPRQPVVAGFYMLAMVAILFHLYHGVWSLFQTLGANHPKYAAWRRPFAVLVSIVIFLGFVSIPVAVLAGRIPQ